MTDAQYQTDAARLNWLAEEFNERGCFRCSDTEPADSLIAVLADAVVCTACLKPSDPLEGIMVQQGISWEQTVAAMKAGQALMQDRDRQDAAGTTPSK